MMAYLGILPQMLYEDSEVGQNKIFRGEGGREQEV